MDDAGSGTQVANIELSGQLVGDISETLNRLNTQLGNATLVQVSCAKLIRVDFIAAGDLLNWVIAKRAAGRHITFTINSKSTTYLQIADLDAQGHLVNARDLVPSARFEQAYTPRFSPDGKNNVFCMLFNEFFQFVKQNNRRHVSTPPVIPIRLNAPTHTFRIMKILNIAV